MPEYIIVLIIKNAITNCYKIRKEKKRERNSEIKGDRIDRHHMTDWKRRQKLAKCCRVSLRSWMNQWNCSEVNVQAQSLGKIFQLWALKCGTCLIFPENSCNHRSRRIEAIRSHRYGCRSSTERVCNRSVRTTLTREPSCFCLIQLKTELIIKLER